MAQHFRCGHLQAPGYKTVHEKMLCVLAKDVELVGDRYLEASRKPSAASAESGEAGVRPTVRVENAVEALKSSASKRSTGRASL